ncbi:hypothetical protein HAX54_029329, partial [Datura stramonium]|nr:hypothetical protein [Datura stramonium]
VKRLWLHNVGRPVIGSAYELPHKVYYNLQSGLQESFSGADEVNRSTIFVMEEKIAHLSFQLAAAAKRERLKNECVSYSPCPSDASRPCQPHSLPPIQS